MPKISVLMSVYNSAAFLEEAVDSILSQTFSDFEFIIVNDGSTDESGDILANLAEKDKRIQLIENEENIGLTRSLNKGLAQAKGEYIARMDADDISFPQRLEKQVAYLEKHAKVGLVGSQYDLCDADGKVTASGERLPENNLSIQWRLLFRNSFIHSSVMIRRRALELVEDNYNVELPYAQDFELWSRVARISRVANLPEVYVYLREHDDRITVQKKEDQEMVAIKIARANLNDLMGNNYFNYEEAKLFRRWFSFGMLKIESVEQIIFCKKWLSIFQKFYWKNIPFSYAAHKELYTTFLQQTVVEEYKDHNFSKVPKLAMFFPGEYFQYLKRRVKKEGFIPVAKGFAKRLRARLNQIWVSSTIPYRLQFIKGRYFTDKTTYLFFPSNDTHVHWMMPIAKKIPGAKFIIPWVKKERADYFLSLNEIKYLKFKPGLIAGMRPKVLVVGNDWYWETKIAMDEMTKGGGKSVVIQEGCLDFKFDGTKRMQYADYAFVLGEEMKKYLVRDNVIVTGNPKFDVLQKFDYPEKPVVMINCNFTYNIFEDIRSEWVSDVVEACNALDIPFFISQHPRDKGEFPEEWEIIKSNAFKIEDQLKRSTVLVSRFSTVIYEALFMGRQVVYYNFHQEPFRLFSQDKTGGLVVIDQKEALKEGLEKAINEIDSNETNRTRFLELNCNYSPDGSSSAVETVVSHLEQIANEVDE